MTISGKTVAAVAVTAIAVPTAILAYFHQLTLRSRIKGLPHPPSPPILGNTYDILSKFDDRFELFTEWSRNHGPNLTVSVLSFEDIHVLITVDPAVIEHVLKTNFDNYVKGPRLNRCLNPLLGDGIFGTDGHQWKWQRKVSSHIFTGKNFRNIVEKVIHEELDNLIAFLDRQTPDKEIDLHLILHCFTMDSFGQIGFSDRISSLRDPTNPPTFSRSFDELVPLLNFRFPNPIYTWTEWLFGGKKLVDHHVKVLDDYVYEKVKNKRERNAKGEKIEYKDLLDLFMEHDSDMTDLQLRDMVLNMILAGRDTTAQALSWAFWVLDTHPEIISKISQEVLSVLGEYRTPTYDEINQLKYTNAVFFEVLRLYPSVPIDVKVSLNADVLPGGIEIPANTEVNYAIYSMGRMESLWGPDCLEFKPERWIDANGNVKRESQYKWLAFNAGPRICLGQNMATVEAVMTLAALCPRFRFKVSPKANVVPGLSVTLSMKYGLPVSVEKNSV
ncbi:hypothetical protein HDU97_010006 [Phlyctochytrium planicorne]|nr:hypothetical protein HDU97_010006 [Phlyctochytrium planicorne]